MRNVYVSVFLFQPFSLSEAFPPAPAVQPQPPAPFHLPALPPPAAPAPGLPPSPFPCQGHQALSLFQCRSERRDGGVSLEEKAKAQGSPSLPPPAQCMAPPSHCPHPHPWHCPCLNVSSSQPAPRMHGAGEECHKFLPECTPGPLQTPEIYYIFHRLSHDRFQSAAEVPVLLFLFRIRGHPGFFSNFSWSSTVIIGYYSEMRYRYERRDRRDI